jgi:ribosomal protein S18 acetylase RimI-like enzyme
VGHALVEAAAEHVRAAGAPFLRLHVVTENEAARRLYLATGFVDTGVTVPLPRDPNVLEHVMERRLT